MNHKLSLGTWPIFSRIPRHHRLSSMHQISDNYFSKKRCKRDNCLNNESCSINKAMNTPSVKRQAAASHLIHWINGDAWEWVWDRFRQGSVTMYSNGYNLALMLSLDARRSVCLYPKTSLIRLEDEQHIRWKSTWYKSERMLHTVRR